MRRTLTVLGVAVCVAVVPQVASAKTTRATIVARSAASKTITVAFSNGSLRTLHTSRARHLRLGTVVRLRGSAFRVVGHTRHARIRGLVTARSRYGFNLSGNGATVTVTDHNSTAPADGTPVVATTTITDGSVVDDQNQGASQVADAEFTGTVVSLTGGVLTLNLASSGTPLAIQVPTTVDTTGIASGQQVEVAVNVTVVNNADVFTAIRIHAQGSDGEHHNDGMEVTGSVTSIAGGVLTLTVSSGEGQGQGGQGGQGEQGQGGQGDQGQGGQGQATREQNNGTSLPVGSQIQIQIGSVDVSSLTQGETVEVHVATATDSTGATTYSLLSLDADGSQGATSSSS